MHIICFDLYNSFVVKINIYSCENYILCEFLECDKEKEIKLLQIKFHQTNPVTKMLRMTKKS